MWDRGARTAIQRAPGSPLRLCLVGPKALVNGSSVVVGTPMVRLLSVALMNEPGAFAHVATTLENAGLHFEALMGDTRTEVGVTRFLVSDPEKGYEVLEEAGHPVQLIEAVKLQTGDDPGEFAQALQKLGQANVNIEMVFGVAPTPTEGEVIFLVDDPEAAKEAIDGS